MAPKSNFWVPRALFFATPPIGTGAFLAGAQEIAILNTFDHFWTKGWPQKKSRLRGWDLSGEIRAGILISIPASDVQNGWMATQLVTKRCDLGSLGVPARLAHPWALGPPWVKIQVQAKIHKGGYQIQGVS